MLNRAGGEQSAHAAQPFGSTEGPGRAPAAVAAHGVLEFALGVLVAVEVVEQAVAFGIVGAELHAPAARRRACQATSCAVERIGLRGRLRTGRSGLGIGIGVAGFVLLSASVGTAVIASAPACSGGLGGRP